MDSKGSSGEDATDESVGQSGAKRAERRAGTGTCVVYGALSELLTAKPLRLMQDWTNIRVRNIGTRNRLPESTSDGMIWRTRTTGRFVANCGGPDPRLTLDDRKRVRGVSESSRCGGASRSACRSLALHQVASARFRDPLV